MNKIDFTKHIRVIKHPEKGNIFCLGSYIKFHVMCDIGTEDGEGVKNLINDTANEMLAFNYPDDATIHCATDAGELSSDPTSVRLILDELTGLGA